MNLISDNYEAFLMSRQACRMVIAVRNGMFREVKTGSFKLSGYYI